MITLWSIVEPIIIGVTVAAACITVAVPLEDLMHRWAQARSRVNRIAARLDAYCSGQEVVGRRSDDGYQQYRNVDDRAA